MINYGIILSYRPNWILAVLVTLYLSVSKCTSDKKQIDCTRTAKKPSEDTLKQMYKEWLGLDYNDINPTFELIKPLNQKRYKDFIPNDSLEVLRQRIYGNAKCRKKLRRRSRGIMNNSLCPWYVEITVDKERYPEMMANARCTCQHCYDFNGFLSDKTKRIGQPRCQEIKHRYKVLRIEKDSNGAPVCHSDDSNTFRYKTSYEEVTIGCTCVLLKDKVVPNQPTKTGS